jgi:hypothetical protein
VPSAKIESLPVPSLPDTKSTLPPSPLPSPFSQLPPLPDGNSSRLVDDALKPATQKKETSPAPAIAVKETLPKPVAEEKSKRKKYAKKKSRIHVAARTRKQYFRSERLPDTIYKKSYNAANRHLPMAHYEREYDALVFLTAERDDLNGLRAMLGTGRSVNLVNGAGDTVLLAAVRHNAINTVRLLLALHADPNVRDRNGMTPLAIATEKGNYPMMRALQEMGAHPVQMSSAM